MVKGFYARMCQIDEIGFMNHPFERNNLDHMEWVMDQRNLKKGIIETVG